jgi:hypothetical protein
MIDQTDYIRCGKNISDVREFYYFNKVELADLMKK